MPGGIRRAERTRHPAWRGRPGRRCSSSGSRGSCWRSPAQCAGLPARGSSWPSWRPSEGPKRTDTALLLGILLAKTELDAARRADPAQEPPRGLTQLLAGYCSAIASRADETRLRLLSLRLIRNAIEATLDDDPSPLSCAVGDCALAAAGLIDADRLTRTGAGPAAVGACIDTAAQSLTAATTGIN
ncbi:hypothetical protein ACWGJX_46520, partial [Streptomyces sp. NPDC054775]